MILVQRPNPDHAPAYAKYYFDRTQGEDNLMVALQNNLKMVQDFIQQLPIEKADFQYADDKWTVKGVLMHIIETERIFQYRALRFSRQDETAVQGFDESWYVQHNNYDQRTMADLSEEFSLVRQSTMILFKHMNSKMIDFEGPANNSIVTPRSLGWMIVGHTIHHCDVIKERYLVEVDEQY